MAANEYQVTAQRVDAASGLAHCKDARIVLDTALPGRADAFNPAELFLAAIAGCMIKGIERVTPMLKFRFQGVRPGSSVQLTGMSERPLLARVPVFRLHARIELGASRNTIELVPDTLLFFPEVRRCLFTFRASFIYRFVPKQLRRVVLERRS